MTDWTPYERLVGFRFNYFKWTEEERAKYGVEFRRYPHTAVAKDGGGKAWRCRCPEMKPYRRHTEPSQCLKPEDVEVWRAHYPEATCSDRIARTLIYLAKEFGR